METTTEQPRTLTTLYISKDDAAAILGISPRRVLDYAQTGALHSIKQRDPDTGQIATRLSAEDVEKLRDERANPTPQPPQPSQEIAREVRGSKRSQTVARREEEVNPPQSLIVSLLQGVIGELRGGVREGLLEGFANHSWPLPMYLSIDGAVRFSGLRAEHIQIAAKEGRVAKVGRKYRRSDLEKL